MTLKMFFNSPNNLGLSDVINKKIVNQNLYAKHLIRNQIVDSNSIFMLDNNNNFSNISHLELSKFKSKQFEKFEGCSLNTESYIYKNKRNDALCFKSFLLSVLKSKNNLQLFYQSLQNLKNIDKGFSTSLIILKPVKGGFTCYSSGVLGFLPRSHGVFFLKLLLFSLINDSNVERKFLNFSFLGNRCNFSVRYFIFRLKFLLGKVTIYYQHKRKNFSKSTKKKKRTSLNNCNFVFLSYKSRRKIKN